MEYTRSEVSKLIGITPSTLQNYDTWGLVRPKRNQSNYRVYTEDDLEKLREVMLLRRFGLEVEKDILPIMQDEVYNREKVLTVLLTKLNEAKRQIEKEIRLTSLIQILGTDALGLNDPKKPFQESIKTGLDLMGTSLFDDLFQWIDTLSDEEAARFNQSYQTILEQFQTLLKKNVAPDDPRSADLIKHLIDETYALLPSHLLEKTGKSSHALMIYYLAIFTSDTHYRKKCDLQYGPALAEYIADCCLTHFGIDWLEDSEDILEQSIMTLHDSKEEILPDPLLNQWDELLKEYLGRFNPAYITADYYLSLLKEILLDGYESSTTFTSYLDRLFELLADHLTTCVAPNQYGTVKEL